MRKGVEDIQPSDGENAIMMMVDDCHACRQPRSPLYMDKLYKHSICKVCFVERREEATKAMHTEWFLKNIPFDQMSDNEKLMSGIYTAEEYARAKERPKEE